MKLQFTNGYRPNFDQISRILQFIQENHHKNRIARQIIVEALGIPEKQVENLTSMMVGFGLVEPRKTILTPLSKAVIRWDPYFDKIETLWIIHYLVSSNPNWVVWYRVINQVLPDQDLFEVDKVSQQYFIDLAIHFSERTIAAKLPKEVSAVFASYTRSELSQLHILEIEKTGRFIKTDPIEVPVNAFLICLIYYRDRKSPGSTAMNIDDICLGVNSPGMVLNLTEYETRNILSKLHSSGLIRIEKFGNLDQVRFSDQLSLDILFQHMYER